MAFLVGIPLGMVAAYFRDRWPDAVLRIFAILCYATPVFFVGLLLKLVFAVWLGVLPVAGPGIHAHRARLDRCRTATGIYLIDAFAPGIRRPSATCSARRAARRWRSGCSTAGIFLRLVRTNVIGTLSARLRRCRPLARRAASSGWCASTRYRPALIPIITVIGLQIALLLGGAVLTETTFEWKGLGFQLAQYLAARDFVAVQGIVALLAVIVAVTNFIVDIIAALIDPRVRY